MDSLNAAIDKFEEEIKKRGMKIPKINYSNYNFYQSNPGFYERTLKISNDNYFISPKTTYRTFHNIDQSNLINQNITSNKINNEKTILSKSFRYDLNNNKTINNILLEDNNENNESDININLNNTNYNNNNNNISFKNKSMMISNIQNPNKSNLNNKNNNNNRYNALFDDEEYNRPLYGNKEYETRKLIENELGPYVNNVKKKMNFEINQFQKDISNIKNKTDEIENVKDMIDDNINKIDKVKNNMDYMNRNLNDYNKKISDSIDLTKKKYLELTNKLFTLELNLNNISFKINEVIEKQKQLEEKYLLILNGREKLIKSNIENLNENIKKNNNNIEEILNSQIQDFKNISGNNEEISKLMNDINSQLKIMKNDINNMNLKIENKNTIDDINQKLNELKNKIEINSEKLNEMKDIEINEFQIPKESPIQTQINDDDNINKEEIKEILYNLEKNYLDHIKKLEKDCNQLKDEQKNYNIIILKSIETIKNEIENIKNNIEENNYDDNLESIEKTINNQIPFYNNFNSEINILKEDVNQIKKNKSYDILPILLQKIEVLENKLSNGNNI